MDVYEVKVDKPHEKLARLMERELGIAVAPVPLKLFVLAFWSRVSLLAHQIHNQADEDRAK